MIQTVENIKRLSDHILSTKRPIVADYDIVISDKVLRLAADKILSNLEGGYYKGEFEIEEDGQLTCFDVSCRLSYSPFRGEENVCTGVLFYFIEVTTWEDGEEVTNDFTAAEFSGYFKG